MLSKPYKIALIVSGAVTAIATIATIAIVAKYKKDISK